MVRFWPDHFFGDLMNFIIDIVGVPAVPTCASSASARITLCSNNQHPCMLSWQSTNITLIKLIFINCMQAHSSAKFMNI